MHIMFYMFIILIWIRKSGILLLLKRKCTSYYYIQVFDITGCPTSLPKRSWQSCNRKPWEKKLQLNIVKMNDSGGWPTHVSENKTVYVGYTCSATLLMLQLKGCLLQLQLQIKNITINNWFPNDSWSSLIFETQRLSTAQTIKNDKTISSPSTRHWVWPRR